MVKTPVDTTNWGRFRVGDLFDIRKAKTYADSLEDLDDGGATPLLCQSTKNQGVCGYTSSPPLEHGGVIVCGDVNIAALHWVPVGFAVANKGRLLVLTPRDDIGESAARYFMCLFRVAVESGGFGFSHKLIPSRAADLVIKAPQTNNGEPDYEVWGGGYGSV